jgi:hypothetical protein
VRALLRTVSLACSSTLSLPGPSDPLSLKSPRSASPATTSAKRLPQPLARLCWNQLPAMQPHEQQRDRRARGRSRRSRVIVAANNEQGAETRSGHDCHFLSFLPIQASDSLRLLLLLASSHGLGANILSRLAILRASLLAIQRQTKESAPCSACTAAGSRPGPGCGFSRTHPPCHYSAPSRVHIVVGGLVCRVGEARRLL